SYSVRASARRSRGGGSGWSTSGLLVTFWAVIDDEGVDSPPSSSPFSSAWDGASRRSPDSSRFRFSRSFATTSRPAPASLPRAFRDIPAFAGWVPMSRRARDSLPSPTVLLEPALGGPFGFVAGPSP